MALSSGEKKLFVLSALVIAVPLGAALLFNRINATPTVSIAPYPKAPNPNGYDVYLRAANAIVAVKPAVSAATETDDVTDPKVAARRYSLKRKDAWLAQNQAGFALFDLAMKLPTLAPPMREINNVLAARATLRQLARHKLTQSDACWMRGDAEGALRSGLDIVQMGHQVRRGGLIDYTFGISISTMGRATNHVTVERLNAAQAQNAARRLEQMLATRYGLDEALTEDKYSGQAIWMKVFRQPNWRKGMSADNLPYVSNDSLLVYTVPKQRIIDDIGTILDRQIARARLPYLQTKLPPLDTNNPFVEGYTDDRIRFINARDLAGDELLMVRLALRAHRLRNGAYPATLNALTPDILKSVPADPFGAGESWRYKRKGNTYLLWSIGPDGKDDGGTPIPWEKSPRLQLGERPRLPFIARESKGDYVAGKNN